MVASNKGLKQCGNYCSIGRFIIRKFVPNLHVPTMSDPIKHECGIALLRLKQPLQYYVDKYGTAFYGLNKTAFINGETAQPRAGRCWSC